MYQVKIGYYVDGEYIKPKLADFKSYWLKTRDTSPAEKPQCMMLGNDTITAFCVTVDQLAQTLIKKMSKDRWLKSRAMAVSIYAKSLTTWPPKEIKYEHLINTLPAPTFLSTCCRGWAAEEYNGRLQGDIEYKPVYFYLGYYKSARKTKQLWEEPYDFMYFPKTPIWAYRATKYVRPWLVMESIKPLTKETTPEGFRVVETQKINVGKVVGPGYFYNKTLWEQLYNISHVGRLASWQSRMMLHDVVEALKNAN
jgi:hypothetical protein